MKMGKKAIFWWQAWQKYFQISLYACREVNRGGKSWLFSSSVNYLDLLQNVTLEPEVTTAPHLVLFADVSVFSLLPVPRKGRRKQEPSFAWNCWESLDSSGVVLIHFRARPSISGSAWVLLVKCFELLQLKLLLECMKLLHWLLRADDCENLCFELWF